MDSMNDISQELCEDIEIEYNKKTISLCRFKPGAAVVDSLFKSMQDKIGVLEKEVARLKLVSGEKFITNVDDALAKDLIIFAIKRKGEQGGWRINLLEIINETHLPIDQINRVMDGLEAEKQVNEIL
jgi:hypothetical protein